MNKPFAKKTTIIILIILALLAIGLAYCLLAISQQGELNWDGFVNYKPKPIVYEELKTEMDTGDWLVYNNKDYGLSFKYPKDWEVWQGLGDISLMPKKCPYNVQDNSVAIIINPPADVDSEIVSVDELLSYYRTLKHEDVFKKIGEYKFNKVIWHDDGSTSANMVVEYKKLISQIFVNESCYSFKYTDKIFDAILTTLKFYD